MVLLVGIIARGLRIFKGEKKRKGFKGGNLFLFICGGILLGGKVWRAINNNKTGRNYNNRVLFIKPLLYFLLKTGYKKGAIL